MCVIYGVACPDTWTVLSFILRHGLFQIQYKQIQCMFYRLTGVKINIVCAMFLVPDEERMKKQAGEAISNFKDLVFPADYTPGSKRKVLIL